MWISHTTTTPFKMHCAQTYGTAPRHDAPVMAVRTPSWSEARVGRGQGWSPSPPPHWATAACQRQNIVPISGNSVSVSRDSSAMVSAVSRWIRGVFRRQTITLQRWVPHERRRDKPVVKHFYLYRRPYAPYAVKLSTKCSRCSLTRERRWLVPGL